MKKKDLPFMPEYYDRYINLCDDKDIVDVLSESTVKINDEFVEKMKSGLFCCKQNVNLQNLRPKKRSP